MYAVSRRAAVVILWAFAGLTAALIISLLWQPEHGRAQTTYTSSWVYWGIDATNVYCEPWIDERNDPNWVPAYMRYWPNCWHDDEHLRDPHSAIDYNWGGTPDADVGLPVQLWYTGRRLNVSFTDLNSEPGYFTYCTGVRVILTNGNGQYSGDLRYLHLNVFQGVIGADDWLQHFNAQGEYFWADLGAIAATQSCAYYGAHLHQSANIAGWTSIQSNSSVNPVNTWVHRIDHPLAPEPPRNLRAGAVTSTSIETRWDDTATESQYKLAWSPDHGQHYYYETLTANDIDWIQQGLSPGLTINYWVQACNAGGCSAYSNGLEVTANAPPLAPSNQAVSAVTATSITTVWWDSATTEEYYQIAYSRNGGAYVWVDLPANTTAWTHSGLNPGDTVTYWVRACNDGGCSAWTSPPATGSTGSSPAAPSSLHAVTITASSVTLAWTDNAANETVMQVVYSLDGGATYPTVDLAANTTTWTHSGLAPGQMVNYWVRTCNPAGCSTVSNGVEVTTTNPPAVPTGLAAGMVTDTSIQVHWNDTAGESGYTLTWTLDNGATYPFVDLGANVTSHTLTGLVAGQEVTFWVRACNAGGCSAYSAGIAVRTGTVPPRPAGERLGTVTASSLQVLWNDVAGETVYWVAYTRASPVNYQFQDLPANITAWTHSGLGYGETYHYHIQACSGAGCSAYTEAVTATTGNAPPTPVGFRLGTVTANSLQVLWNDGAGETAYQLAWAPAANPGAMTYVDLAGNSTDWTHVGLGPAQTYYYWLRACFFALCSEWAGHVEGTTSGLGALPDATADVALMDDAGTVAVLSKVVASRPPAPPPATAPAPGITAPPAHRAPVPPVRPATARAPATLPLPAGVGAPRTTVPPAPVTIPMRPPRPASAPPPSSNRAR